MENKRRCRQCNGMRDVEVETRCPECHGRGTIKARDPDEITTGFETCPECQGKRFIVELKKCPSCNGTGWEL